MLPDFPETKRLFANFFQRYMRQRARELSPFGAVQVRLLHEGREMKITRADLSQTETRPVTLSAMLEIKFSEVEDLTLEAVIKKYDEVVLEMVRKQTEFVQGRLGEEIPPSQTVNAQGRKLNSQILYDILDKMELEFYPDGRPHEIHVHGPQFTSEALDTVLRQIRGDPTLLKRFDELMARKREEWRVREANRTLVG